MSQPLPSDLTSRTNDPGWTLVIASAGAFMTFMDALIVTTALPAIRTSLHAPLNSLEWTVNSYNLAFASLLLAAATLGDRFGRKKMFCLGLVVFTAASAGAGLAGDAGVLIAFRTLQGAGAALLMPLSLTLVSTVYPDDRRGWAIGVWGGIGAISGAIGPVVGGVVVAGLGWRWIFWINVPLGLALIPLALRKVSDSFEGRPRLDLRGLILASLGLFGVTWGLVHAAVGGWADVGTWAPIAAGALVLALFVGSQTRASSPLLPLDMFRSRRFVAANAVSFLLFAGLWGALFLMSQFLQSAQGHSPLVTGAMLLCWSAPGLVLVPLIGRAADRIGNRPFMIVGLVLETLSLGWLAAVASPAAPFSALVGPLFVSGVGISCVFPTMTSEAMSSVATEEIGVASGTNATLREVGGVFGVALLTAVFSRPGVYLSASTFTDGFRAALMVGAFLSVVGLGFAWSIPRRAGAARSLSIQPAG